MKFFRHKKNQEQNNLFEFTLTIALFNFKAIKISIAFGLINGKIYEVNE